MIKYERTFCVSLKFRPPKSELYKKKECYYFKRMENSVTGNHINKNNANSEKSEVESKSQGTETTTNCISSVLPFYFKLMKLL